MATKTIEQELLKATGEDPKGDDESSKKYIARLVKSANGLEEGKWGKLSEDAQSWVNGNVEAINENKPVKPFPAADDAGDDEDEEEEEKPAKKSKKAAKEEPEDDEDEEEDEEEEEDDEDEEEEKPAKKSKKSKKDEEEDDEDDEEEEDDEDEKPAKKKSKKDDDEDDGKMKTRGKAKAKEEEDDEDDEDEDKPKKKERDPNAKKGAIPRLKELVVKHPQWKKSKLIEQLEKEGFTTSANTVGIAFYDVRNTLKIAKRQGVLKDDYAEKIDESDNRPEQFKKKDKADKKKAKKQEEEEDDE